MNKFFSALFISIGICSTTSVHGAIVFLFDETAWGLAAGSPTFAEDFGGFADGADTSFRTAPVALNGMAIQQEGSNLNFRNEVDVPPLVFPDNNGTANASSYVNSPESSDPGTQVRIIFDLLNEAFGFETWDAAELEGVTLEVYNGTTLLGSQALSGGDAQFLGYVLTEGDTATSVRFRATTLVVGNGGEGFGLDNLVGVSASSVPEPTTLALLGLGLAGLGFARRKRQANL